jgi:tetratricopeptide (TPR) repeat protein
MQDEIAVAIAAKLQLKLAAAPAVARQYTPSLPAYEAFLKGRHHLEKLAPDAFARGQEFFDQAIALDPGYVEPYIALALSYAVLAIEGRRPAREAMPLARSLARKVLELDPSERRAHALLGSVAALYDWNWKEAHEQFRLARVGDPSPFEVRAVYAAHYLAPFGRFQEAAEELERAVEQDPLNVLTRALLVFNLSQLGMHERAMDEARKALEIDASHPVANLAVCVAYLSRGMLPEALASAERAHALAPWHARVTGILAGILARTGRKEQAGILIEQLKGATPFGMVLYHCICSEIDAATDWYQKAIEQREPNAVLLANSSLTKPSRESARWPALAKRMNLPGTA